MRKLASRVRAARLGFVLALCASVQSRASDDPFVDVSAMPRLAGQDAVPAQPEWSDNLLFRKEVYLLFAAGHDNFDETHEVMSRVSAGFEVQKRFSTATRTVASADYQGRIVYRDHALDTSADPMGRDASPWRYETHNAYVDAYSIFGETGRYNLRAGYFYAPFGLNQQTDTHGTLLQLSNDRLFGSERDWQMTMYGALNDKLDYTVGYLLGSGPDQELEGQSGLGVARAALNNDWLFKYGWEGGVSFAAGERVDEHAAMRAQQARMGRMAMSEDPVVRTWRIGADARKRIDSEAGPFTLTAETAAGEDEDDAVLSGLAQADWLHPSRRWGTAMQYQHMWQDAAARAEDYTDARASGVLTYYFRNDVGNANLHWVALALERQVRQTDGPEDTLLLLQYYRYW